MGEGDEAGIDEDKIIVRSNGTVTYTGKDIAYQLWKLGQARPRLPLPPPPDRAPTGAVLWTTTSGEGEAGRRASATPTRSTTSSTSASPTRSAW